MQQFQKETWQILKQDLKECSFPVRLEHLYKYRPAEVLLLRDGYDVRFNELFKATLLDLIYKKVIHYEMHQHFEVKTKYFACLSIGKNYHSYAAKEYETAFALHLLKGDRIFLSEFIKKYLIRYKNQKQIKNQIIKTSLPDLFDRNFLDGVFNRYKRNDHAKKMYGKIVYEIQYLESLLQDKQSDNESLLKLLTSINGNILFLDAKNNPVLKEIEKEIQKQILQKNDTDIDLYDVEISFDFLDAAFSTFDFSSFEGSGCGDFGGGGSDGSWELFDLDMDLDFS